MGKTVEHLKAVRAKLEQGWTVRASARDANGKEVAARDETAVCWCLHGAITCTDGGDYATASDVRSLCHDAASEIGQSITYVDFNDSCRTKDDILGLVDHAIKLAGENGTP